MYIPSRDLQMKKINPLGMRVLVKIIKPEDISNAGLYLPQNANTKDNLSESVLAEVISVASAIDDDTSEETNISGIPLGARVLIQREIGIRIPWDDNLRLVETLDVLAVVEEINLA